MVEENRSAVQSTLAIRTFTAALKKCEQNGHMMGDVYDVTRVSGGHPTPTEFRDSFKAQCQYGYCAALLRFHAGSFGGEAVSTMCIADKTQPATPMEFPVQQEPEPPTRNNFEGFTLNDWRDAIHQYAIAKGWWDTPESRNFGDLTSLLHTEISEAYEEYRNGNAMDETYYDVSKPVFIRDVPVPKPEGIPTELADLMIRVFDMCGYFGIDLEYVLTEKHIYNLFRPYRHGGKVS